MQGDVAHDARPSFKLAAVSDELAADGVAGGVLITSFGAPSGNLEADVAWCRLVNDWVAQECAGELHRFAPGIQLPLSSVEESIDELERAAGLGLRPALLPDVYPGRHWLDPEWEPLWEALEGLDVPVTMHVGDGRDFERRLPGGQERRATGNPAQRKLARERIHDRVRRLEG